MAWLRIDDGFAQHPKVILLVPRDRWTWLEILCYCARYRTDGRVPEAVSEVVRGATPAYLGRCYELQLLDMVDGYYYVHDWDDYNGRDPRILATERKRRQRGRDIGVTSPGPNRDISRDENVTRAQAPARVPSPTPTPERQNQPTNQANEASYDAPADTANNGHGWQAEVDEEGDHDIDFDTAAPDFDYDAILRSMPE